MKPWTGPAVNKDARRVRRGCTNKQMRSLILAAMATGARYRMTKCGVMFLGPRGSAAVHLTATDHRALENFRTNLHNAGIITKGTP